MRADQFTRDAPVPERTVEDRLRAKLAAVEALCADADPVFPYVMVEDVREVIGR